MSANENIWAQIQLLVTDLDGTILGGKPEFKLYNEFRDLIEQRRARGRFSWAICTGRGLRNFREVFLPLRSFGIAPDFVIAKHAYIYERQTWGYLSHFMWNLSIMRLKAYHRLRVNLAIPRIRRLVGERIPFCRITYMDRERICFRFEDDETADFGTKILQDAVQKYEYLKVFHYRNEVDVHMVPFTKGLSMKELGSKLMIPSSHIMVIGNGHNDMSMMDPKLAKHCGCPVNADPEVIDVVHQLGGHIADRPSLGGVIDVLRAFTAGAVSNALPEHWIAPDEMDNPMRKPRQRSAGINWASLLLLALAIYSALLVFASFGIGPFRGKILGPYLKLIDIIKGAISSLMSY
jgi:hydroxymethylpyrimidine pyrophosphatase-like HAD family hydrolase